MALKTSAAMQTLMGWKQKAGEEAGEIKDGSKRARRGRTRTQKRRETLRLPTAPTCSPRGCGTTAACSLAPAY